MFEMRRNKMNEWEEMMSDRERQSIAISMLKEAKRIGGILRNRDIVFRR